jgi:hypothetical protein
VFDFQRDNESVTKKEVFKSSGSDQKNLKKSGSGENLITSEFMKVREEKLGKASTASTADFNYETSSLNRYEGHQGRDNLKRGQNFE